MEKLQVGGRLKELYLIITAPGIPWNFQAYAHNQYLKRAIPVQQRFFYNENIVFISNYFGRPLYTSPLTLTHDAADPSETNSGPSSNGQENDPNMNIVGSFPGTLQGLQALLA